MVKVNTLTLTFDISSSNQFLNSLNILFDIFILLKLIKYHFHFFKSLIKPKFDQVNSSIKVNHVLYGSTRSLHYT